MLSKNLIVHNSKIETETLKKICIIIMEKIDFLKVMGMI